VHSFPLDEVYHYLHSNTVQEVLTQALLDAPMFEVRWRWNATRALAVQRNRAGRRVPPQFQRMDAEDLVAQVFPDQLACQENIVGKRDIPDHPLVRQTVHDCLTEAMDIDGLLALLRRIEADELELVALDLREPSPFAQEIINARPYAFLDDAPFEERRTNAIRNRSWSDPAEVGSYSELDEAAIARVCDEAWPLVRVTGVAGDSGGHARQSRVRDADELHDALFCAGFMTADELAEPHLMRHFETLQQQGRVCRIQRPQQADLVITAEMLPPFQVIWPDLIATPAIELPEALKTSWQSPQPGADDEQGALMTVADAAVLHVLRHRLEVSGPITARQLAEQSGLDIAQVDMALLHLERQGFAFRGQFWPKHLASGDLEWCERRLLQRIHRYTLDAHREAIKPVSLQAYTCYLFELHELRGQGLQPRPQAVPSAAAAQAQLDRALQRLDGMAAPAAAWEADIIPARLGMYDPSWLDLLCATGRLVWGRYGQPARLTAVRATSKRSSGPIKTTPITLASRRNWMVWRQLAAGVEGVDSALTSNAAKVFADVQQHGASFFTDIRHRSGLLPSQLEDALSDLVAAGHMTSDSFTGLRALLMPRTRAASAGGRRRSRTPAYDIEDAGRWSVLTPAVRQALEDEELESLIMVYLQRWGVLSRQMLAREVAAPAWRDLLPMLRRMELRGTVRGGRFLAGIGGEQFTLPETVAPLRDQARRLRESGQVMSPAQLSQQAAAGSAVEFPGELPADSEPDIWSKASYHSLSAVDPVNHLSLLVPDIKLARTSRNRVLYRDGVPVAVLDGAEVRFLREVPMEYRWALEQLLRRQDINPRLRAYLG